MTDQPAGSSRWSWLVLGVVVAASVYLVARNREVVADTFVDIGVLPMLAGLVLGLAGTGAIAAVWLLLLRGMEGSRVPTADGLSTFFVTQLGKYVPGAIWPIVAQVTAAGRWGLRKSAVVGTNLMMLLLLALTGTILGLVLLPWVAGFGLPWLAWASLLVPALAVLLYPGVLRSISRQVPLPDWLDQAFASRTDATTRATVAALVTWGLLGGQLWVLLHAAGGTGPSTVAAAVGGAGLAWAVGLVVVFAPAGAGAREAVLVAVCAPIVGTGPALAVALASRILLTLADVLLALVGAGWRVLVGTSGASGARPVEE